MLFNLLKKDTIIVFRKAKEWEDNSEFLNELHKKLKNTSLNEPTELTFKNFFWLIKTNRYSDVIFYFLKDKIKKENWN